MRLLIIASLVMMTIQSAWSQNNAYKVYDQFEKSVTFENQIIDIKSNDLSSLLAQKASGTKFYKTTDNQVVAIYAKTTSHQRALQMPGQSFSPLITAFIQGEGYPNTSDLDPANTGYVDICFGDSILFKAAGDYPNSLETTGSGYSQNNENMTYEWTFSDNTVLNGDSVWFLPSSVSGYNVELVMTDTSGYNEGMACKIRISNGPVFTTTIEQSQDICAELATTLNVGIDSENFSGESSSTSGNFQLGGNVAGETFLPDGTGSRYSTSIFISGFNDVDTVSDVSDLNQICADLEHSYLGDLEIWLECPDGSSSTLVNARSGGAIPGGFGGGSTHLGSPFDPANPLHDTISGEGWTYCWSSNPSYFTFGTFEQEHGASNFIDDNNGLNSMNPNGTYQPDESFTSLIGCPLNGNWSIFVQDNDSLDNGYIFQWSIDFDASFYDNIEAYEVGIDGFTFESTGNETTSGSTPNTYTFQTDGDHPFLLTVTDDFGCKNDTTIQVRVEDCTIEASNVMTVNNDGVNDNLIIDGVEFWPNTMLKIYDRWGKLVFESENYQNDWNGNVKDSNRKAPAGTYYYFVQRSIDPAPQTGFLTLLRED